VVFFFSEMSTRTNLLPALHTTGTFPELAIYNHSLRIDAVLGALTLNKISNILDLGCGDGALIRKICASGYPLNKYIGIDSWQDRLDSAQTDLETEHNVISFLDGSMTDVEGILDDPKPFQHLGAVVMLESIEHVPRTEVGRIESGVFGYVAPSLVVVTTPDATKRLSQEKLDARGHYFEWDIPEFEEWAIGVTESYPDYSVDISQLTGPSFVRNTQIATFSQIP
jgi:hypothetical protein